MDLLFPVIQRFYFFTRFILHYIIEQGKMKQLFANAIIIS